MKLFKEKETCLREYDEEKDDLIRRINRIQNEILEREEEPQLNTDIKIAKEFERGSGSERKERLRIADEIVEAMKRGNCLDTKYKLNIKGSCGLKERDYEICLHLAKKEFWMKKHEAWKENMNYHRERRNRMKEEEKNVKRNMEKLEEQHIRRMEEYEERENLLKVEKEK
jgi:hypothetical protein